MHSQPNKLQSSRRSFPHLPRPKVHKQHKKAPCYDWVFSSATDVHIAIDKTWFKTFTPFDTYVTTIAGQKPITVRGIGSVDLKIRCKPNSHQSRQITLDNVLYVPGWVCNIFSDVYFSTAQYEFEHNWTQHGVSFVKKQNGKVKAWGYTESFCRLDRLVLSRKPTGRSPMLEDKEREVWSVNLHWPLSQREKWDEFKARELARLTKEHEAEILAQQQSKQTFTQSTELLLPKNADELPNPKLKLKSTSPPVSVSRVSARANSEGNLAQMMKRMSIEEGEYVDPRMSLNEISVNRRLTVKGDADSKVNSLKASFNANRGLLKEFLALRDEERENISLHQKQASIGKLVKEVEAATRGWSS